MASQATIDLGQPRQNGFEFPTMLVEKYQPRIRDFIGLEEPKRIMLGLLKRPRPCSLLFLGDPGSGKTVMASKLAEELPAIHHHVRAQSCGVDELESIWHRCHYIPKPPAQWHILHVSEADGMTDKAQLQLLSWMDSTAALKPVFGGGFEPGEPLPIIKIFTANSRIVSGVAKPPAELLPRFLSRCLTVTFENVSRPALAKYLAAIWKKEKGNPGMPMEYFEWIADGMSVRDALNRMDSEIIANRSVRDVRKMLASGLSNPDAVIVHEDEERWDGFMLEDTRLESFFPGAKITRFDDRAAIVGESQDKCMTLVTQDGRAALGEIYQKQRLDNATRCGNCSWGLLVVPDIQSVRKADILKGVKIGDKLVPWKAIALANLCVTLQRDGRVTVRRLARCQYCQDRYSLPKHWKLSEETAGQLPREPSPYPLSRSTWIYSSAIVFPNGREIMDLGNNMPIGYRIDRVETDNGGVRRTHIVWSRSMRIIQFCLNVFVCFGDWVHDYKVQLI